MPQIRAGDVIFDVDAVAFDKDGTLIDLDAAWGPAALAWVTTAASGDLALEETLAARLGLDLATGHLVGGGLFAVGTVGQLYETTLGALSDNGAGKADARASSDRAREMSALAGEKGNLVALGDVTGTFRSLQEAGLRLAIVSSDDRSAIDSAIDALSVGPLLEAVVAGDEGLDAKPAPAALIEAARRLRVEPARLLYVGDSWVDAESGRAAGVAGVVLVGDQPPDTSILATVVVPGIDSLHVV
ncbi:MAG TPA: HAD-IA family hydrolase [Acidimicrobiia bacterium]|nr:HAD-IA family hydrolase [Acidimicrobiia bacterium]